MQSKQRISLMLLFLFPKMSNYFSKFIRRINLSFRFCLMISWLSLRTVWDASWSIICSRVCKPKILCDLDLDNPEYYNELTEWIWDFQLAAFLIPDETKSEKIVLSSFSQYMQTKACFSSLLKSGRIIEVNCDVVLIKWSKENTWEILKLQPTGYASRWTLSQNSSAGTQFIKFVVLY